MSIQEFELPDELKEITYEKILAQMLQRVDDKYDKLEGSFVFDMIAPSALEAAELIQFYLALGLKMNFHYWASGKWLDYHARDCSLERRPATHAQGDLKIKTSKPVTFPKGFVFSVPSENGEAAIDFETLEETIVDGEGIIKVQSVLGGRIGNVAANSIEIMKTPVKNVVSITQAERFIGGTEPESDDSLRERIDDFYAGRSSSFVGNCADYRRWALSVAGVGYVHVIPTAPFENVAKVVLYDKDNQKIEDEALTSRVKQILNAASVPNSLKIVLADSEGNPALPKTCAAVEKKIFGTSHSDLNRLAPIGVAAYSVESFRPVKINVSFEATLSDEEALVKKRIEENLREYFKTLADDELNFGVLKYVQVSAVLSKIDGLDDFKHLRISKGDEALSLNNISFNQDEIPNVGTITFTSS